VRNVLNRGLRFAIYARVSTESQEEEGQSLDTQVKMMVDHVRHLGGTVAKTYRVQESAMPKEGEISISRPSINELFRDVTRHAFDAVMVCKLDRLSRSIETLKYIERNLVDLGILLFEGAEQHNLRSAEGSLTRGMQALIGEYSVNRMKWAAAASRFERAMRGWPHSKVLPFGRKVAAEKNRRDNLPQWSLDPVKLELVQEMYRLYIEVELTFAEVGRRVSMNPETVRRILMNQSGPVWVRSFRDPAIGKRVEVKTTIPALLTQMQIDRLHGRAKQNQVERAGWKNRKRCYPLSQFVRCSNPACNWSNLSGHQTYDAQKDADGQPIIVAYAYYQHLKRNMAEDGCFRSIPAEQLEDEIFSRIGQFIKNSDELAAAVREALIIDPVENARLQSDHERLTREIAKDRRTLANVLEVVFEEKGTAAADIASVKVRELNAAIADATEELTEIDAALKLAEVPEGLTERFSAAMSRLTGLHGHVAMHWPPFAKTKLLRLFLGGDKSTRFDRAGKYKHSDRRGIFVSKVTPPNGEAYWTYDVKGRLGSFSGAITDLAPLYDYHFDEEGGGGFSKKDLTEITALTERMTGLERFRTSHAENIRAKS
jgi:DNA invertase Pin-like site-specific DNA recombinase